MVFLYAVIGLVALVVLLRWAADRERRAVTPSVERYHRAMDRLGEMSEHVRVLDDGAVYRPLGARTMRDASTVVPREVGVLPPPVTPPHRHDADALVTPQATDSSSVAQGGSAAEASEPAVRNGPGPAKAKHGVLLIGRLPPWAVVAAVTIVLGGTITGVLLATASPTKPVVAHRLRHHSSPSRTTTLPNLVGLSVSAAEARLSAAGLSWQLDSVPSPDTAAVGHVVSQTPASRGTTPPAGLVTLDVGKAIPTVRVPDVSSPPMSVQAAEAALKMAGLRAKTKPVKAATAGELALQGKVEAQDPTASQTEARGSVVTLEVLSGAASVTVPADTVGETPAQAGATLASAQLRVGSTTTQFPATVAAGAVVSTAPYLPGQSVPVGTTINLVISAGPPAVVPELRGDELAKARRALKAAGLTLGRVSYEMGASGVVLAQAARAGRTLPRATPIALVVGSNPTSEPTATGALEDAGTENSAGTTNLSDQP